MFGFDKLITPKIISALYIITFVVLIGMAVINLFTRGPSVIVVVCVLMAFFSRIFFECVMVAFKNNEYLRRIAESLENK